MLFTVLKFRLTNFSHWILMPWSSLVFWVLLCPVPKAMTWSYLMQEGRLHTLSNSKHVWGPSCWGFFCLFVCFLSVFIYLAAPDLAAHRISSCAMQTLKLQDVGSRSLTRDQTVSSALGARSLSHGLPGKSTLLLHFSHISCSRFLLCPGQHPHSAFGDRHISTSSSGPLD